MKAGRQSTQYVSSAASDVYKRQQTDRDGDRDRDRDRQRETDRQTETDTETDTESKI